MTCIFLKPSRADTQGSVISAAPPAQTVQKEEEEKILQFLCHGQSLHISSECLGFD